MCPDSNCKKRDDIRGNVQIKEGQIYRAAHASRKLKGDYDGRHDNPLNRDPFSPSTLMQGNAKVEPAVNVSQRERSIINVTQIYY